MLGTSSRLTITDKKSSANARRINRRIKVKRYYSIHGICSLWHDETTEFWLHPISPLSRGNCPSERLARTDCSMDARSDPQLRRFAEPRRLQSTACSRELRTAVLARSSNKHSCLRLKSATKPTHADSSTAVHHLPSLDCSIYSDGEKYAQEAVLFFNNGETNSLSRIVESINLPLQLSVLSALAALVSTGTRARRWRRRAAARSPV